MVVFVVGSEYLDGMDIAAVSSSSSLSCSLLLWLTVVSIWDGVSSDGDANTMPSG